MPDMSDLVHPSVFLGPARRGRGRDRREPAPPPSAPGRRLPGCSVARARGPCPGAPPGDRRSRAGTPTCLLYTSDAADDLLCVDLGGRRIIKKKKKPQFIKSESSGS